MSKFSLMYLNTAVTLSPFFKIVPGVISFIFTFSLFCISIKVFLSKQPSAILVLVLFQPEYLIYESSAVIIASGIPSAAAQAATAAGHVKNQVKQLNQ